MFLSPERLASREVDNILRNKFFQDNLVIITADEIHVMVPWGKDFRQLYHQIALVLKRLPRHIPFLGISATVAPGKDFDGICNMLSLKAGEFYCLRLSNERSNVRSAMQELTHGLNGYTFPDIGRLSERGHKAVIYCRTIDLGFRVAVYLWNLLEPGEHRLKQIRVWNSLTSSSYNAETLQLFRDDPKTTTIIATIAFGMGMNVCNIKDVVNLGLPDTINALVQQDGRAGRDPELAACGRTFIEPSVVATARDALGLSPPKKAKTKTKKQQSKAAEATEIARRKAKMAKAHETLNKLDDGIRRMVLAHVEGRCLVAEKNRIYGNDKVPPDADKAALSCLAAGRSMLCSSCDPSMKQSPLSTPSTATAKPPTTTALPSVVYDENGKPLKVSTVPLPPALTVKERQYAQQQLDDWSRKRWRLKSGDRYLHLPSSAIWTEGSLVIILESFHLMRSLSSVRRRLCDWRYLADDGSSLFELLEMVNRCLDRQRIGGRKERAKKTQETKDKNKLSMSHLCAYWLLSRLTVIC